MRFSLIALLAAPLAAVSLTALAASPEGRWQTIDDESGKARSVVEIEQAADGTLSGTVVELIEPTEPNPVCSACEGEREDQPIIGMTILWDVKPVGENIWNEGKILDPSRGKTYSAKVTLDDGGEKLEMRGYLGYETFGRSQTWVRE